MTVIANDDPIDLRSLGDLKGLIERAAALSGQSVSDFVLGLAIPKAREVIRRAGEVEISERDSVRFLAALDDADAEPSPALRRAVERSRAEVL